MNLVAILDFVAEAEKRPQKNTGLISKDQYAYCKYLVIIRAEVYSYITKFWW